MGQAIWLNFYLKNNRKTLHTTYYWPVISRFLGTGQSVPGLMGALMESEALKYKGQQHLEVQHSMLL
jgi:hypothetical protein